MLTLSDAVLSFVLSCLAYPSEVPLCRVNLSIVQPAHGFALASFVREWRRLTEKRTTAFTVN